MSLVKLSGMTIKSPFSWNNCYTGLCSSPGKTFLGFNKEKNFVHFFQKNGKNSIKHFTVGPGPFGKLKPGSKDFLGAVHEFTNKDAKRKLKQFNEVYEFSSPESAKRFRDELREL